MVRANQIYRAVDKREEEIIEVLQEFVAIETENPPGKNYSEGAEFLVDALKKRKYDVERVSVPEEVVSRYYPSRTDHDRCNVLGRRSEDMPGPDIHFTGHFDVVPAGADWSSDPYEPHIEDGRLYGRGTSDMKSGIVASLFAIDVLDTLDVPIRGSITQSMTIDEETGGFTGLGYLVDQGYITADNTDFCSYTECFDASRVCLGHRGVLKFRVVTTGAKAHGCMAHDRVNAVTAMQDFLRRVDEYEVELHSRTTSQPVVPSESRHSDISVTMIDAGYSENVVPDRCTATFYRVLVPDESIEKARAEIRMVMEETEDTVAGTEVKYEEIMYAEPALVSKDCEASRTYTRFIGDFYENPGFVVSPGSDDQRFLVNDAGIEECIVYGPGLLEQAHSVDEYVPISTILTATKVMAAATADMMGTLEES